MTPETPDPNEELQNQDDPLELIRSILIRRDLDQVEDVISDTQIDVGELATKIAALQEEVAQLKAEKADRNAVIPAVGDSFANVTSQVVNRQPNDMSEALAPIIAMTVRKQVANSKEDMVEAMAPIMVGAIGGAIQDALREFQQQIDARLSRKQRPQDVVDRVSAEMRGVTSAEVEMRNALPFHIREAFLIQQESGLLLAHYSSNERETDSDLIGAMLTAIRDFVGDAFLDGGNSELQEIQYGDEHIIIKSGRLAYCALVLDGVEPSGMRMRLQEFVADLHARYSDAIKTWNGDPDSIQELPVRLTEFANNVATSESIENTGKSDGLPGIAKLGLGCMTIAIIVSLCFTSWFVFSLVPVAYSAWQDDPTATTVPTVQPPTSTPTPIATPTLAPTSTLTPLPTETPLPPPTATTSPTTAPTATPTASPVPTNTPLPTDEPAEDEAFANAVVWLLSEPDVDEGLQIVVVNPGNRLIVESENEQWTLVVDDATGARGWIMNKWLDTSGP